jgi:hypothetical protein
MTNLSYPTKGMSAQEIANYFGFPVADVALALEKGCKTFQEVYDFVNARIE